MLTPLVLTGCLSMHSVTTRPEYAYPQNLVPLCGSTAELLLENTGEFHSGAASETGSNPVLLGAQLIAAHLEQQRHYQYLRLQSGPEPSLTITAFKKDGESESQMIDRENLHCVADGELQLHPPSASHYFWASVGTREKILGLWTNPAQGLVVHNRWQERYVGLVGGTASGDTWALFNRASPQSITSPLAEAETGEPFKSVLVDDCVVLTGSYEPVASVVHLDGTLATRTAVEQFFREEIIGKQAVNREPGAADRFSVRQGVDNAIELSLYEVEQLLGKRSIEAGSLRCDEGKWRVSGQKQFASAWLLLMGSGGVYWEDLLLWRDGKGDLLVEGIFKRRSALFLVPMANTESIFMVFPLKPHS